MSNCEVQKENEFDHKMPKRSALKRMEQILNVEYMQHYLGSDLYSLPAWKHQAQFIGVLAATIPDSLRVVAGL